jgi:hypothetical protein
MEIAPSPNVHQHPKFQDNTTFDHDAQLWAYETTLQEALIQATTLEMSK